MHKDVAKIFSISLKQIVIQFLRVSTQFLFLIKNHVLKTLLVNSIAKARTKLSSAYDSISTNLPSSAMQFN